jgi:hypothetical protein
LGAAVGARLRKKHRLAVAQLSFLRSSSQTPGIYLDFVKFLLAKQAVYQHGYQQIGATAPATATAVNGFISVHQIFFCSFVILRWQSPPIALTAFSAHCC